MKLIGLFLCLLISSPGFSQENEQDGPAECAAAALARGFSHEQAVELCRGAVDDAPARCAVQALARGFSYQQAIDLCSTKLAAEDRSQKRRK